MKCYVHRERDAVGICKACQKGVCPDCVIDMEHGIACKGRCEDQVATFNKILKRNSTLVDAQRRNIFIVPAFTLCMGAIFLGWSFWVGDPWRFTSLLGLGFIIYGMALLRANLRWAADSRKVEGT